MIYQFQAAIVLPVVIMLDDAYQPTQSLGLALELLKRWFFFMKIYGRQILSTKVDPRAIRVEG